MKTQKKTNGTTAITRWDDELAKAAAVAAEMEDSVALGQFISLRGGQMVYNDAPLPNNQTAVVVLDAIMENVYYEGAFDATTPQSPVCFAFGRDDAELKPHELATKPQAPRCQGCPRNEWGSADRGRGKACRNTRRLGLLAAGTLSPDGSKFELIKEADHWASSPVAFLKLPVTSVRGFAAFVKQVAATLKRPPYGIFTRLAVVPDPKTQFKVTFNALGLVPRELLPAIHQRALALQPTIGFPYQPAPETAVPAPAVAKGGKAPRKRF